jgi:endoglucanase
MRSIYTILFLFVLSLSFSRAETAWIRINLLGYKPTGVKVAVWCAKANETLATFELVDAATQKVAFSGSAGNSYGAYGPFVQTYRLDFSSYKKPGRYFLRGGTATSLPFSISDDVYKGTADFSLLYMRQQRSKYNPFLKDSCHTQDGYTMDGPMPDSTHLDVSGGWHDATDYLQYSMTSANATYHLLAAYRDFPEVFSDKHLANGLAGQNGVADVFDEAKWGLDWLIKMHPKPDWMFNQLADDRDHKGFRLPNKDTASYGNGLQRPIYFLTGEVQGLGKYKNRTKGTSSTAGKFTSAFALGASLFKDKDITYAATLESKASSAYAYGLKKPGNTQTACYVAPYFYEEDNWVDDMELAAVQLYQVTKNKQLLDASFKYASQEKQTPWLGTDTAGHYQWYPFVNVGHYELAKTAEGNIRKQVIQFYRDGIKKVWEKGKQNAFYRGVPFIWCSNNLQAAFAVQCYWYRQLTGDTSYSELEQATFDWLLGCNPWGTSMIVGMPSDGDFPDDPHSSLNFLHGYQTLGALVDGPVYGTIYRQQRGVSVVRGDEYEPFQSSYVVYHDDYGDYVTNEPTMDGTANLIYLLAAMESNNVLKKKP